MMLMAVVIVFLALSVQFNSFRDPMVILVSVPMLGVLPLVLASGVGSAGRYAMGLVIFTGLSIGTLFVVLELYMLMAKDRSKEETL